MDVGIGEKRRTIRSGARHFGSAQRVVGAGAIFHDPGLAEDIPEAFGEQPADGIDVAAGCGGNDQADVAALLSTMRSATARSAQVHQSQAEFCGA